MTINNSSGKEFLFKAAIISSLFHFFLLFAVFRLEDNIQAIAHKQFTPKSVPILIATPDATTQQKKHRPINPRPSKSLVTSESNLIGMPKTLPSKELENFTDQVDILKSNPSNNQKPAILDDNAINKYPRDASKPLLENKVPKVLDENLFANAPEYKNKQTEKEIYKSHSNISSSPNKSSKDLSKDNHTNSPSSDHSRAPLNQKSSSNQNSHHDSMNSKNNQQNVLATQPSDLKKKSPIKELPRCKNCKEPVYPRRALRQGTEGSVLIRVLVAASGNVIATNLLKSSGSDSLDSAAIKAASTSTFYPMSSPNSRTIQYEMNISN